MNTFPGGSILVPVVFAGAVLTTVAGALIAVLSIRLVRCVCGLALCCFGLALLYYFLHSPFLTLMEILIYVGAICVTIIFAVMLAEPDEPREPGRRWKSYAWAATALVVSGGVFWGITRLSLAHPWKYAATTVNTGRVRDLGISLLTTYSLAFELISLVLLVAILGALVVARYGRTQP
jgi:NADH:ubiquinone oxidoreductase subunit 6 (subunit J)